MHHCATLLALATLIPTEEQEGQPIATGAAANEELNIEMASHKLATGSSSLSSLMRSLSLSSW